MRKKFSKIPPYWQRVFAKKAFGSDDDCVMQVLQSKDPEIDERTLSIKVEMKNELYLDIKRCKK